MTADLDIELLTRTLRATDKLAAVDVALGIATAGVPVLPTVPGGKEPMLTKQHIANCAACRQAGLTPAAEHGATRDPQIICRYWGVHPDAGVGMKDHARFVRGDGDFDDVASLKKARKQIGYGQPFGCREPFEARTPGSPYRRRYLHLLPDGVPAPGGGTSILGVSWYGSSGYTVVKGTHPNGTDYPPFVGSTITDLPEPIVANLQRRTTSVGSNADAATSADVEQFLSAHRKATDISCLLWRTEAVRNAKSGERHHLVAAHLWGGLREAVAGMVPASTVIESIRDAVRVAGWDQTRFDDEWGPLVAWAVGQVKDLTPDEAREQIAKRRDELATMRADHLEHDLVPPEDDGSVDLTPEQIDAELAARNARQDADGDTAPPRLKVEMLPDPFVVPELEWHAIGLLPRPSHGEAAGPEKSLKSYFGLALDVGLAAGLDVLGRWRVPHPQRVLLMVGEGGRNGFLRRVRRICEGYGITVDDVRANLRYSVETAPVNSDKFRGTLADHLDAFQPDLVHVDPWYSYAPGNVDARNLYEQGYALNSIGELVAQGGATLLINNHFNSTGTGGGLQRISMAGHAEWCDSWLLLGHRETPDVANGRFRLKLAVGSRQWGGADFAVDFDIGRWDEDANDHVGRLTWQVTPHNDAGTQSDDATDDRVAGARHALIEAWNRRRGPHRSEPMSKSDWLALVTGIGNTAKRKAFAQLEDSGAIRPVVAVVTDRNQRTFQRQRYELDKYAKDVTDEAA